MTQAQTKYVLVLHGGAGTITKASMTPEKEAAYKAALSQALQAGYAQIKSGETAVEAVAAAIEILENSPLFNAGKGAVFTAEGKNELDASIMYSKNLQAGAVAGVSTIKNPIKAAIAVMRYSPHVLLIGKGAEEFASLQHLELVPPEYFYTAERYKSLQKFLKNEANKKPTSFSSTPSALEVDYKFGTVGAVALDHAGNLAAGTSTGGMTGKKWNRVGDAPLIGSGTYANSWVGVSATGWGEFFIRTAAARTLAAKMEYQGKDVKMAGQEVIQEIEKLGGDGGLIALDKNGQVSTPFNTSGMYRGTITDKGEIEVQIYR